MGAKRNEINENCLVLIATVSFGGNSYRLVQDWWDIGWRMRNLLEMLILSLVTPRMQAMGHLRANARAASLTQMRACRCV
jgi:hypothetical protein